MALACALVSKTILGSQYPYLSDLNDSRNTYRLGHDAVPNFTAISTANPQTIVQDVMAG